MQFKEKVIKIAPEGLALTYISNSEVLNFFITAGVNMDLFYRLLWRHVFAVEIIKEHYNILNEITRDSFLTKIRNRFSENKQKQEAIDYLLKWGESFWKESEYRVKEITKKLEQDLGASVTGALKGVGTEVKLNGGVAKKLSEEEKLEVVHRGQSIVAQVQMKTLSSIMDLLEKDLLNDKQKKYYITIDRLDENWVNDDIRYHLIKALLDTIRDFNSKIQNVKIIIAIREDLLDRVFRYTRNAGYQEEKYKSLYLHLRWKEEELENLLDLRVNQLIKEQYTKRQVKAKELLPLTIDRKSTIPYILERTMLRPRDAIMFFNDCLKMAEGKARITQTIVKQAEALYSENRLRSLADEWSSDYANLIELSFFLKGSFSHFDISQLEGKIEEFMLNFLIAQQKKDYIYNLIKEKFDIADINGFMQEMFKLLFRVGIVGIKQEGYATISWSYQGQKLISSEINQKAIIYVHPAFWRVLGIKPKD